MEKLMSLFNNNGNGGGQNIPNCNKRPLTVQELHLLERIATEIISKWDADRELGITGDMPNFYQRWGMSKGMPTILRKLQSVSRELKRLAPSLRAMLLKHAEGQLVCEAIANAIPRQQARSDGFGEAFAKILTGGLASNVFVDPEAEVRAQALAEGWDQPRLIAAILKIREDQFKSDNE